MSVQMFLVDKIFRLTLKRRFRRTNDILELRHFMNDAQVRRPTVVPPHVTVTRAALRGVETEVLSTARANASRAFLYIHGGAWVAGSPATHRALTWRLAHRTETPVYAVDYRLAPEHPFPAGVEDCVSAYRGLLDSGVAPRHIVVGGDSAGGHLSLVLSLALKREGLPQPGALVCLSPATTMSDAFDSHTSNQDSDAMFAGELRASILQKLGGAVAPTDPRMSPVRGDLSGLPPTLIHCGEHELLRDDGVHMAERLRDAGVRVELAVVPRAIHAWHVLADLLPEARHSINKIATFVRTHTH